MQVNNKCQSPDNVAPSGEKEIRYKEKVRSTIIFKIAVLTITYGKTLSHCIKVSGPTRHGRLDKSSTTHRCVVHNEQNLVRKQFSSTKSKQTNNKTKQTNKQQDKQTDIPTLLVT